MALLLFTIFSRHLSGGMIVAIYLLYMAGCGYAFGNIMTSGLQNLTVQQQADGNAILTTLQQFAGAMGTSVVAAIIAQSQKQGQLSNAANTANGSHNALLILLVLALIEWVILFKVVVNNKNTR